MKTYILSVIISILFIQCSKAQESFTVDSIEYFASSRGNQIQIKIEPNQIIYNHIPRTISNQQWERLMSIVNVLELKTIDQIEAPTNKRFSDAAASAFIKIFKKNIRYESASFDHGNPPKEFSNIVSEILKLAEI